MTAPTKNGPPKQFRVVISEAVKKVVRASYLEARDRGIGHHYLRALTTILNRLRQAADDFGEPLYRLHALRMQLRHAVVLPLSVDFGVHEDRPIVFIRGIRLMN